ncbi:hypothetical protein GGE68_001022 [Rhizobium leguminosarum]|nr:hypothetical protein [Rhizobium leguminosarum]
MVPMRLAAAGIMLARTDPATRGQTGKGTAIIQYL